MPEACQDEASMPEEEVVPFPNEQDPKLGMEMMSVFDADVIIDLSPNAGSRMKAVLLNNRRGVAVVANSSHKTFLQQQLEEFVRQHHLANTSGAPEKPEELKEYEKTLSLVPTPTKQTTTGQASPPLPLVLRRWFGDRRSPSMSRRHRPSHQTYMILLECMMCWGKTCVCGRGPTWSLLAHCCILHTLPAGGIQATPLLGAAMQTSQMQTSPAKETTPKQPSAGLSSFGASLL